MGRIKQAVLIKRKATNKNKKSKYKLTTSNIAQQTYKNGVLMTKYSYTKKIVKNGKARYYYA